MFETLTNRGYVAYVSEHGHKKHGQVTGDGLWHRFHDTRDFNGQFVEKVHAGDQTEVADQLAEYG